MFASPKRRVLDCGSGWGALSFWLAKEFDHVFALDSELDGLRFTGMRAAQEGVEHLNTVQGSISSLPFPNAFFDVVVLNGVLEWIGTFSVDAPPQSLQEAALREIRRVLRPQGTLFVAIENRYGLQYFLGYKEEHTGLRFVSLLPRVLANAYHRARRGSELRALTHSRRALTGMLRKSGFHQSRWFLVYPSYRNCRYAASLDGPGALSFLVGTLLERPLPRSILRVASRVKPLLKLGAFFSPSWIVFASPESAPRLGLQSPNGMTALSDSSDVVVTINSRRANLFEVGGKPPTLIGKHSLPLNERACRKTQMSFACVQFISRSQPKLKSCLPQITLRPGKLGPVDYTPAIPGTPLELGREPELRALMHVLLELNRLTVPANEIRGVFAKSDLRQALRDGARELGLLEALGEVLDRAQILHGDLNCGNILLDRRNGGRLTLVDFEHAHIGPAVLNWYDFLLRNVLLAGDRLPLPAGTVIQRLEELPGGERADRLLHRLSTEHLDDCRLSRDLHHALITLYLHHLCSDPILDDPDRVLRALGERKLSLG